MLLLAIGGARVQFGFAQWKHSAPQFDHCDENRTTSLAHALPVVSRVADKSSIMSAASPFSSV